MSTPNSYCYSSLLSPLPILVAEKEHAYHFLTERHIQAVWFEQKYFKDLKTASGDPIEVISAGIWNADAGPDFRKCHLKIGHREVLGDIEIHLSDDFWYQHQHEQDPRYNHVVLHVSLWHPRVFRPILLQSGQTVPQIHLEHYLTVPEARIAQLIDLDLYPYKKFLGSGRCAHAIFKQTPEEQVARFFQKAADWRLQQKRTYLKSRLDEDSLCLGAGIATALGYKNNSEAFLDLFIALRNRQPDNEEIAMSFLMTCCNFFEKKYQDKWMHSSYYRHLKALSSSFKDVPIVLLNHSQVRPLNQPIRRLVYLVKMHFDQCLVNLFERMKSHWDLGWPNSHNTQKWRNLIEEFQEMLPSYQDRYWNYHYSFEDVEREDFLPLIGQDTKREVLVNTFLPLLHAHVTGRGNLNEMTAFDSFFEAFPASHTGKTRYLIHRYFGNTPKGQVLNKAYTEQGAYQLHYDFCIHYEASCEGCPFVERYQQVLQLPKK